jgi:high-affinity K+ transport system ATPase subunit B
MSGLGGTGPDADPSGFLDRLITAIERAARAGWPETARLIALLAVAAAAVALVIAASR